MRRSGDTDGTMNKPGPPGRPKGSTSHGGARQDHPKKSLKPPALIKSLKRKISCREVVEQAFNPSTREESRVDVCEFEASLAYKS